MLANPYECNEANFTESVANLLEKYIGLNNIKGNLSPLALELMHDIFADFNAVTGQISKKPTLDQMGTIILALQALHHKKNRQMWYLRPDCASRSCCRLSGGCT